MILSNFKYFFVTNLIPNFFFHINFTNFISNILIKTFYFNWKISNYADSYWFLYSNKKTIFETRYFY